MAMTAEEIVEGEEVVGVDGPWVETWFHFEFDATIFAWELMGSFC